ncbi:NACHT domain-containing protein [Rhodococcus sp. MEB032]|uniref:NACHT domain-containing protein n=1 Tax=Rhodococcus sp. MEB032 TaxID=3040322 RepID=UPI00254A21DC|nr:NACHT domain-containing protein [Rhodococcus sp. MEB032]
MPVTSLAITISGLVANTAPKVLSGVLTPLISQRFATYRQIRELHRVEISPTERQAVRDLEDFVTTKHLTLLQEFQDSPTYISFSRRFAIDCFTAKKKRTTQSATQELAEILRLEIQLERPHCETLASIIAKHQMSMIADFSKNSITKLAGPAPDILAAQLLKSSAYYENGERNLTELQKLNSMVDIHRFIDSLKSQVAHVHRNIRPPVPTPFGSPSFNDIYVPPDLIGTSTSSLLTEPNRFVTPQRLVVLGNPGEGKTTLLAAIARQPPKEKCPIIVVLRDYARALASAPEYSPSISEYIGQVCRNPYESDAPEGAIEYLLNNGRAVVLFDGLDELVDLDARDRLVKQIEAFCNRYPEVTTIVTSRHVGYEMCPLAEDQFDICEIAPMSDDSVYEFIVKWFELDSDIPASQKPHRVESLFKDSTQVRDLRSNPLLLSLICNLYSAEGWIPQNRPKLYEKCSMLLFDDWDRRRSIEGFQPFTYETKEVISAIALWMIRMPQSGSDGVSHDELLEFMVDDLHPRAFEKRSAASDEAQEILRYCTGRAWVLVEIGQTDSPRYDFAHRTFLEYFAALALYRSTDSYADLVQNVLPSVRNSTLEIVDEICFELLRTDRPRHVDRFLQEIIEAPLPYIYEQSDPDTDKKNRLDYVARCLVTAAAGPQLRRVVTRHILESEEYDSLRTLMCASKPNLLTIFDEMKEYFSNRQNLTEISAAISIYPAAFARAHHSYSEPVHGSFWAEVSPSLRSLVYKRDGWYQRQYWFRLHRFLESGLCSKSLSLLDLLDSTDLTSDYREDFPTRMDIPSVSFRILMRLSKSPRNMTDDIPEEIDRMSMGAIADLLTSTNLPWGYTHGIASRTAYILPNKLDYYTADWDTATNTAFALLAMCEIDREKILGFYPNRSRIYRFHEITQHQFDPSKTDLAAIPISSKGRGFLHRWLGGGVSTLRKEPGTM